MPDALVAPSTGENDVSDREGQIEVDLRILSSRQLTIEHITEQDGTGVRRVGWNVRWSALGQSFFGLVRHCQGNDGHTVVASLRDRVDDRLGIIQSVF